MNDGGTKQFLISGDFPKDAIDAWDNRIPALGSVFMGDDGIEIPSMIVKSRIVKRRPDGDFMATVFYGRVGEP